MVWDYPLVIIVILNWNNPVDTLACLSSVAALDDPAVVTIVVDNGSSDDSVDRIRAAHPDTRLIEPGENLGYAGGDNIGIRWALEQGATFIGILNDDVIIEPGFLEPLSATLQAYPDVGIATPLVAQQVDGGRVWALGSAVDWRTATVSRQHAGESIEDWRDRPPFEVEIASGAAMLVKREVFEQIGLLDEDFFLYYEEVDWCLFVRQAGYRVLAVPSSIVWHEVSGTPGATSLAIDYAPIMEPFSFVPLESMACGTLVVGIQEAGVRETVRHAETALLMYRDPEQFAAAVLALLDDDARRVRLRRQAQVHVENEWSWERSIEELELHFQRTTEK